MITEFKIFENQNIPADEDDLADLFTQKFIEDYFDNNYEIDIDEASDCMDLWDYVDIDKVRNDLIKQIASDTKIIDNKFNKNDYINFIEDNIKDFRRRIKKYRELNYLGKIELQEMEKDDLINIIEHGDKVSNFLNLYFEDKYYDIHPEEILYDIHGKNAIRDNNFLLYLENYINEDEVINDYRDKIEFESKYNYIRDYIRCDIILQKKLFDINVNTVIALYDVMDDNQKFGMSYKFQKAYIEFSRSYEGDIKPNNIYPQNLKILNDKFGVNKKIAKEYEEYMYFIDSEKYNL